MSPGEERVMVSAPELADRRGSREGRGALQDAVLILLSPVLFPVQVFLWITPLLIVGWLVGTILLWVSKAWTAGQKLIGTLLSAVSLFAFMLVNVQLSVGPVAAIIILLIVTAMMMVPGIVGVLYLSRRRRENGVSGLRGTSR
jgi:hypothetical protein